MASAGARKRRTQQRRTSQKERSPQRRRRQKSHSRRSQARQRKYRGQAKRRAMEKRRKKALKRSFRSFNAETLTQMEQDGRFLSHQAQGLMISFMEDIYKQVSSEAERLRRESRDPLISPAHVQAALQRVVPKRRWRHVPAVVSRNRH